MALVDICYIFNGSIWVLGRRIDFLYVVVLFTGNKFIRRHSRTAGQCKKKGGSND